MKFSFYYGIAILKGKVYKHKKIRNTKEVLMIEILKIIFLGIIEGITEWLPISSTGHMILVDEFIKLQVSDAFKEMFFVVIQLGAIMAVVVLYWQKLFPLEKKVLRRKSDRDPNLPAIKTTWMVRKDTLSLWGKVLIASLPAALIGLPLDDWLDRIFYNYITVAIMLIVYGVLFIVVELRNEDKEPSVTSLEALSIKDAVVVGLFQVLALIPGTSRSGATIVGGMMHGISRTVVAEFTFFLAIPVMFGASFLKLLKFGLAFTVIEAFYLILGMAVAFGVSVFAIRFLMGYIKKHDFKIFGYYRIILGLMVLIYFVTKK